MTSDNTGNKATSPNGLKYKPVMNRKLADIIENAGIVHMFEFATAGIVSAEARAEINNPIRSFPSGGSQNYYLGNLASAVSGKNSGICSKHRQQDFYNSNTGMLETVAGTAIMGKCPIRLFGLGANVGILIDPALVNFSYICNGDVGSTLSFKDTITIPEKSMLGLVTPEENVGQEGVRFYEHIQMPIRRNEADRKTLSEFFNGKFLDKFKNWRKGDTPQPGYPDKCFWHNEVGVNFPPEAVKGVVVYSYTDSEPGAAPDKIENAGYLNSYGSQVKGMMLANLFVEDVKQKGGAALPIIHYDLNMSGELKINEVELEPRKVARILEGDVYTRAAYEHFLGAKKVQDIILGKTVKRPGVG